MEFELKILSKQAIPAALEKAKTYRLLNEPVAAESICRDILAAEDDNVDARISLILAISDQFPRGKKGRYQDAENEVKKLGSAYHQAYYTGLIRERRAMHQLNKRSPGSGEVVFALLRSAMEAYEQAIQHKPEDDDEAILRWNNCARVIMKTPHVEPAVEIMEPREQFDG